MTRFFQDNQGKIDLLENKIIENFICIHWLDTELSEVSLDVIWIKVRFSEYWVRFFFDAGFCFGAKYDLSKFKDVYLEDLDDAYIYSFCDGFLVKHLTIIYAEVSPINTDKNIDINGVKLAFVLSNNQVIEMISYSLNSPTEISLRN